MEKPLPIRTDIGEWASFAFFAPGELIDRLSVKAQALFLRFTDHPKQRVLGQKARRLRIAATHVAVATGKPNLLQILRKGIVCRAKSVVHEYLPLVPAMESEHAAEFIEGDRLAEDLHARIAARVWKLLQAGNPRILAGHDHACHGVPYAEEPNRRPMY